MPTAIKKVIISAGVLLTTGAVPVIPQDMELLYSYEIECDAPQIAESSSTTKAKNTFVTNPQCEGDKYSASVFMDKDGNEVHTQIPRTQYSEMGKADGFSKNPQKEEYVSLFESLATPAEAALAVIANSSVSDSSGVTSITWAHTVASGSNRLLVVQIAMGGGVSISSVTFNGTNASQAGTFMQGGYDRVDVWYLADPTETTANIVATASAGSDGFKGWGTNFTGAASTVDGFVSQGGTSAAEVGVDVTTVNGNYIVGVFMGQLKASTLTAEANQTVISTFSGAGIRPGAAGYKAATTTVTNIKWSVSSGAGENWVIGGANVAQYTAPAVVPAIQNIIIFD